MQCDREVCWIGGLHVWTGRAANNMSGNRWGRFQAGGSWKKANRCPQDSRFNFPLRKSQRSFLNASFHTHPLAPPRTFHREAEVFPVRLDSALFLTLFHKCTNYWLGSVHAYPWFFSWLGKGCLLGGNKLIAQETFIETFIHFVIAAFCMSKLKFC